MANKHMKNVQEIANKDRFYLIKKKKRKKPINAGEDVGKSFPNSFLVE